jgi:site-specific DNA-adenine methylase
MAEYGIPYMGSKSSICNELIKVFPKSDNFYDLFGGGFSVSNAMIVRRSQDYKSFHFNELRTGICELIKKAIAGEFNYNVFKPKFISREEFFAKVDTDAYIKCLWSFGNNGSAYLFSKEIEPYKRSMHNAIVLNEFDELAEKVFGFSGFADGYDIKDKRLFLRNKIEYYRKTKVPEFLWPYLDEEALAIVKRNNEVTQLRQLEQLERLERLEFYNTSYDKVPIKDSSVIYCDPPYAGTAEYDGQFNHKQFLDWAHEQKEPVFISEYNIPDKRFEAVFKIGKRSLLSSDKSMKVKEERVYANNAGKKAFIKHAMRL